MAYTNPYIQSARQRDPRQAYAQQLMQTGSSTSPVGSPVEAIARALQGGLGGYFQSRVNNEYDQQGAEYQKALAQALQSDDPLTALSQSTDPQLMGMALEGKIQKALKGPEADPLVKVFDPITKQEVYRPTSQAAGLAAGAPQLPEPNQTREIMRGSTKVFQEFNPQTNSWTDIGSGPAFAPQTPPSPSFITLIGPDNQPVTLNERDPQVNQLLAQGYVQRSGADPNSRPLADETKNAGLLTVAGPELDTALNNYDALTDTWAQSFDAVPLLGNLVATEGYQQARNSLNTIAQSYLYSTSGATASPEETNKLVESVMPKIGDLPATLEDKKQRVRNMVQAIRDKSGGAATNSGVMSPDRAMELQSIFEAK